MIILSAQSSVLSSVTGDNNSTTGQQSANTSDNNNNNQNDQLILLITVLAIVLLAISTLASLGYYLYSKRQQVKEAPGEEVKNDTNGEGAGMPPEHRSMDAPLLLGSQIWASAGRKNEYFQSWWGGNTNYDY
jgi:hypothetical protein